MSKIYTRTGDGGQTSLMGGTRVCKTHPRLEAYGTIDELSSHLGLLLSMLRKEHTASRDNHALLHDNHTLPHEEYTLLHDDHTMQCNEHAMQYNEHAMQRADHTRNFLLDIQHTLFGVSTLLATEAESAYRPAPLSEEAVAALESEIDVLQADVPPLRAFVIPGGCAAAAQAHVCRTVCRRAERRVLLLDEQVSVDENVKRYINRLSDYLFILARHLNFIDGTPEIEHR